MKRTGFKKAPVSLKRTAFKRRAPKKRPGHDKTMLEACRGAHCYLEVDGVCCGDTATVVPCHANWGKYGKGMGIKSDDRFTVPGCWLCHSWLDSGKASGEEKRLIWEAAYKRWAAYRDRGE